MFEIMYFALQLIKYFIAIYSGNKRKGSLIIKLGAPIIQTHTHQLILWCPQWCHVCQSVLKISLNFGLYYFPCPFYATSPGLIEFGCCCTECFEIRYYLGCNKRPNPANPLKKRLFSIFINNTSVYTPRITFITLKMLNRV